MQWHIKEDKKTTYDPQNTAQKTKDWATLPPDKKKGGGEFVCCNYNMKDITRRAGMVYPSGTPETTPGF